MNFLSTVKDNRRYVVYGICNNFSHFLTRASNISMMVEAFTRDYVSAHINRMEIDDYCEAIKKIL